MIFRIREKTHGATNAQYERTKVSRLAEKGTFIRLKQGLYSDDKKENPLLVANALVVPSYVSFEYALSMHGLIPERVYEITCATIKARGELEYENKFGRFSYRNVPVKAYSAEIDVVGGALIAKPEKALCDLLHRLPSVRSRKELMDLLFEDLRLDEVGVHALDFGVLSRLCELYPGDTFHCLRKYLEDTK